MKNFQTKEIVYPRIYQKSDKELIKYSPAQKEAWIALQQKNIPFLNTPTKIEDLTKEEQKKHPETKCKITIPYLKDYNTLGDDTNLNNLTTKELLILIKKIITITKKMHQQNIYHTDIHSENIMTKNENIVLIDLDAMIIENYISKENIYEDQTIPFESKITQSINDDKLSILSLLLYYLKNATFKNQMGDYIDLYHLKLPKQIEQELSAYQLKQTIPNKNYYYEDIINELIKTKYQSPILKRKK